MTTNHMKTGGELSLDKSGMMMMMIIQLLFICMLTQHPKGQLQQQQQ
jgi:hypothetical protein